MSAADPGPLRWYAREVGAWLYYKVWDRLGVVVTTRERLEAREQNAFKLGVDAERVGYTDRRTSATPAAIETMRMVAESAGQDLDAHAAAQGVDLTRATMGELNRLGREIAKGMSGVTSVSVSSAN